VVSGKAQWGGGDAHEDESSVMVDSDKSLLARDGRLRSAAAAFFSRAMRGSLMNSQMRPRAVHLEQGHCKSHLILDAAQDWQDFLRERLALLWITRMSSEAAVYVLR
jgi:hypothetical protein